MSFLVFNLEENVLLVCDVLIVWVSGVMVRYNDF